MLYHGAAHHAMCCARLCRVCQEVDDIRTTKLQQLQPNPILGAADPAVVLAWTAVDAKATLAAAGRKLRRLGALSETQGASVQAAAVTKGAAESAVGGHGWRELVAEYRRRLLHVVKATYGEWQLAGDTKVTSSM